MSNKPDISIIGTGCVGSALGQLAHKTGYRIAAVSDLIPTRVKELGKLVDSKPLDAPDACIAGELVLLTVPDDKIAPLCKQLADGGAFGGKPVVAHCSGALGSDVLSPAEQVGCPTGSMHPLQTFPDTKSAMKSVPGTYFFIEGSETAVTVLCELAAAMGGNPVSINSDAKILYHAAAVMASNYFVTLMDAACELLAKAGLTNTESLDALGPLMRTTLENIFTENTKAPEKALTGPIARGDVETIKCHLEGLKEVSPETYLLYRAAGLRTISLAEKKGSIDSAQVKKLRALMSGSPLP